MNHVFYDQNSIVYFFKFLSNLYSNNNTPTIPSPLFQPRSDIIQPNKQYFENETDYLNSAPRGYGSSGQGEFVFGVPVTLKLYSNLTELQNFRGLTTVPISTNDILHGLLAVASLKYKQHSLLKSNEFENLPCRVLFARNMRGSLDLPSNITGDYVRLEVLNISNIQSQQSEQQLEINDIKKEILTYAIASRKYLQPNLLDVENQSTSNLRDIYERECSWFAEHTIRFPQSPRPSVDFLDDPFACVVTNWSSFPYEEIKFIDNEKQEEEEKSECIVSELLLENTPAMAGSGCFCRVGFQMKENQRIMVCVIDSLKEELIQIIKDIVVQSNLFDVE